LSVNLYGSLDRSIAGGVSVVVVVVVVVVVL